MQATARTPGSGGEGEAEVDGAAGGVSRVDASLAAILKGMKTKQEAQDQKKKRKKEGTLRKQSRTLGPRLKHHQPGQEKRKSQRRGLQLQ